MQAIHAAISLSFTTILSAQDPGRLAAPSMPVREVTVFKDGHAYVLRDAPLAAGGGALEIHDLPQPVLGTFWPFATGGARLVSAKAGTDRVAETRTAVDLRQIAKANVGKDVVVVDQQKERIEGRLLAVPARTGDAPAEGELLLVATATGTRALPLSGVRDLEVKGEFAATLPVEERRDRLVLDVAGGGAEARVGVMYVQHGLRWIPAYRIDIDGAGSAAVRMEATLVNDLIDLQGATVHLVVGVPRFEFAGLVDPISLQQEVAAVAARAPRQAQVAQMLSNSLMSQTVAWSGEAAAPEPGPEVTGGEAHEDLFVFTVRDVTLRKGERLVLPVAEFALTYRDVHTLLVPFAPPFEVQQGLQGNQILELARELAAPKAVHVLRLRNTSEAPLTTAPALVLAGGRVLAQGRMRYTPVGRETDLEINQAIDVRVERAETEQGRRDGVELAGATYVRIDMLGTIELHNHKREAIDLEVRRAVLGLVDEAGQQGTKAQLDLAQAWQDTARPVWWGWWSWPHWWFRWNGFGEFRWHVQLAPGASTKLEATWHYFWR
jgi:hypothetical protein